MRRHMSRLLAFVVLLLLILTSSLHAGSELRTFGGVQVPVFSGVNMNSANTDHQITTIPWSRYMVRRVTVTNCSTSLGATSTATLGVFTGAGGTGTTVVTAAVIVGLTAASKTVDLTLALTSDSATASSLYVRVGTAQGSAVTCDVHIEATPLA
jgi:hypothetical protein